MDLIKQAESLAPLFRETAREAEVARQPLDRVIDAIRETGLFSMMVPKQFGGHEADIDTFFDAVLTLSRADASMGWITGFYIEHNLWLCHYREEVCAKVFGGNDHVLAPASLNVGGGMATKVDGGYVLNGRWQWGTGIVHSTWVLAGGIIVGDDAGPLPTMFLLPTSDVEPIDTWHVSGMCATGSWDFKIKEVFVPDDHAVPFLDILDATTGIADRHAAPLYSTPLMPVLGFAASLPILGAAQMALAEYSEGMREKIAKNELRNGTPLPDVNGLVGQAALEIETAELILRDVMADVMAKRNDSTNEERSKWLARMAHAVRICRQAVLAISQETGASGGLLSNPIQRAVRDISIASNHIVFSNASRDDVGRSLLGQDAVNPRG